MEKTTKLIDEMNEDRELTSKRKFLIIVSVLFMAMNVSGAQLVEANTFIFKINFTNTLGLGYLLFAGVMIITIRYYSVAYPYHVQIYNLWADAMMKDPRMFIYHEDGAELIPDGLLSDKPQFSQSIMADCAKYDQVIPYYRVSGVFNRSILFYSYNGECYVPTYVRLWDFKNGWTVRHYCKMLGFEYKFQFNALFRRPESLEIMLPYMIASLSLLSFVFKAEIQAYFH